MKNKKSFSKKQNNRPANKIKVGRIELVCWNNTSSNNGKKFRSFSVNKHVIEKDHDNPKRFITNIYSLDGLFESDLKSLKEAVDSALEKTIKEDYGLEEVEE
jgi:hypothetical protein